MTLDPLTIKQANFTRNLHIYSKVAFPQSAKTCKNTECLQPCSTDGRLKNTLAFSPKVVSALLLAIRDERVSGFASRVDCRDNARNVMSAGAGKC